MIREILFSWEAWAIWYSTTAVVWTIYSKRKNTTSETKTIVPHVPPPVQDSPKVSETLIATNYEDEPNVFDIRSRPSKPDWMK